jgi:hypothetical protein
MNRDGAGIGAVTDHGDHLAVAAALAFGDQPREKFAANASPLGFRIEINRILDGKAIGRSRAMRAGIGIADNPAFQHSREIRIAPAHHPLETPRHLGQIWRDQFERGRAELHRLGIDRGDRGQICRRGGPDFNIGHGAETIFAPPKRKAPAFRPGLRSSLCSEAYSRCPSSCSSSVNRLMKFK